MNEEKVNKSIRQMRVFFGFFGVVTALSSLVFLLSALSGAGEYVAPMVVQMILSICFWAAVVSMGKRRRAGRTWATICSLILLIGFPILTIFGVIYLVKLTKPEMKQAFGAT
jgi:hypothetical protein